MKKMKKFLMSAIIMLGLITVPTLNAAEKATISDVSVYVNGQQQTLTAEESDPTKFVLEVPYGVESVSLQYVENGTTDTKVAQSVLKNESGEEITSQPLPLTVGKNTFTVEVKDNDDTDGSTKTVYTIEFTRAEKVEAKLDGIIITANDENGAVQTLTPAFNASTYEYTVTVTNDIEKVFVKVTAAKGLDISGDGITTLYNIGSNNKKYVYLSVRNDVNEYKNYSITIIREESQLIKDLKTEVGDTYQIYEYTNENGQVIIFYNEKAIADGSYAYKSYEIVVKKDSDVESILAELTELTKKPTTLAIEPNEDFIIKNDTFNEIRKNSGLSEVLGYDATWIFDGSKVSEDFKELNVKVLTGENVAEDLRNKVLSLIENKEKGLVIDFLHSGNLPKGTKVRVYVDPDQFGDEALTLYYYNPTTGKLSPVANKLKVYQEEMGASYVEFELEHCSTYVLTTTSNNAQTGVMNVVFYIVLALFSLTGIILLAKKKAN